MLITYMREPHGRPFGVVVATDATSVGYSLCNPKDRFNKEIGKSIAAGRAMFNTKPTIKNPVLQLIITTYVEHMKDRAKRYFK